MRLRAVLLALVLLTLAAPARAATLTAASERLPADAESSARTRVTLTYTAAAGEENRPAVEQEGSTLTLRDPGAPVEPGAGGCEKVDAHAVRCTLPPRLEIVDVRLRTGDGADEPLLRRSPDGVPAVVYDVRGGSGPDRIDAASLFAAVLEGGEGDDVLVGADDNSTLRGGPGSDTLSGAGRDVMIGGAGDDVLNGGAGNDRLAGDGPAARGEPGDDVLDGGAGRDAVDYSDRTAPVVVDLGDPAPDGQAGEVDRLTAVESALGGSGADRLTGDGGANALDGCSDAVRDCRSDPDVIAGRGGGDVVHGGSGADRIAGGTGDDELFAGGGADRVSGGPGADVLQPDPGARSANAARAPDVLRCDRGSDTVFPGKAVVLHRDCERVQGGPLTLALRWEPRSLRVGVRPGTACDLRLELRTRGRRLSAAAARLARRRPQTLRLDHGGREPLRLEVRASRCPSRADRLAFGFALA